MKFRSSALSEYQMFRAGQDDPSLINALNAKSYSDRDNICHTSDQSLDLWVGLLPFGLRSSGGCASSRLVSPTVFT